MYSGSLKQGVVVVVELQWLLFLAPNPHVLGGLVRNYIDWVKRGQSICLVKDARVGDIVDRAGYPGVFPGKGRGEWFLGAGAGVCVVMSVLCHA